LSQRRDIGRSRRCDNARVTDSADPSGEPGIERALRRVVLGFRVVGATWLALLGAVVLATTESADPAVTLATVVLAAGWAAATVARGAQPGGLRSWWWLAADLAVASWTIAGPTVVAGQRTTFFGGFPFTAVVLAVWARGLTGGLIAAGALSAATLGRLGFVDGDATVPVSQAVENVVFYVVAAAVLAWTADVLRRNDRLRREAESALAQERAERIRSQERAETAAHLHDSVLQTLALIQRRTGDPAEVTVLARRQERELRTWLTGGAPAGDGGSFAAAVASAAEEVERLHGVRVEVVTVGDAPLDEGLAALVAAAREALVNAARHSRVDRVAVYAETSEDAATVFVRDRGVGFDPAAVDGDRRGIAESITGRLRRRGGHARVTSAPGAGTEVEMTVARRAP
jgi:signal transduction histidine kinase